MGIIGMADKSEVEKIIDSGVASVSSEGKTITYRNLNELLKIAEKQKKSTRKKYSIGSNPHHDKGL